MDAEKIRCQRCGLACGAGVHRRGDFTEEQQALMTEVMHPVMDFHDPVPDPTAVLFNKMVELLRDFSDLTDDSPANLGRLKYEARNLLGEAHDRGLT